MLYLMGFTQHIADLGDYTRYLPFHKRALPRGEESKKIFFDSLKKEEAKEGIP